MPFIAPLGGGWFLVQYLYSDAWVIQRDGCPPVTHATIAPLWPAIYRSVLYPHWVN